MLFVELGTACGGGDALPHPLSSWGDSGMERDIQRMEVSCLDPKRVTGS